MKKILIVICFLNSFIFAEEIDNKIKTLSCLYKELSPKELLEEKELNVKEHIENLLYADAHKDKYFLKALVLDYYYNASNIDSFYKKAYLNSSSKEKDLVGLYYAFYLQKNGQFKEAITHLKGLGVIGSNKLNIPKKIAYLYEIFGLEKDLDSKAYFKIKNVDFNEIGEEINACTK
ncbi:hypothetical protein ACOTVS_11100 [Aliarcobacter butzleri]|uniref:hypothetical protein n=1 Tax=Aliarcobacter butzleri TaxID=28197 RepID=UPI003450728E